MRVIESQMNNAINACLDWKKDNTEVLYFSGHDKSQVYLHGNLIAEIGPTYIELFDGGVQSKTTKSRLNAILKAHGCDNEYVFQKKGQWFVQYDGAPIPFFSGMRLN